MNTEKDIVRLSARQLTYLKNANFLPSTLALVIEDSIQTGPDTYNVRVSREIAEDFRSVLTDRLAKTGFDIDYEPTAEGKIIEELIDSFYVGGIP